MFWYVFIIVICSLIIIGSIVLRRMRLRAGELLMVETAFPSKAGEGGAARFCFISDLHISMMPVKWGAILDAVKESGGKFLLITGDLVNKISEFELAKQFIMTMTMGAGIPVIITMGNHDNDAAEAFPGGRDAFMAELKALPGDVRVLDDEYTVVDGVMVGGLNDFHYSDRDRRELIKEWEGIAASKGLELFIATHNADVLLELGEDEELSRGVAGVLAGHTHGGQMKMFRNLEFSVLKKDKLPRQGIYYGRHLVNGYELYITSGVGCSLGPWRSGTNPEVVVVISAPM